MGTERFRRRRGLAVRRILSVAPGAAGGSPRLPSRAEREKKRAPMPPRKAFACALELHIRTVYTNVSDPADLVELLEFDTALLELIQTAPPECLAMSGGERRKKQKKQVKAAFSYPFQSVDIFA
ncbi:hypothetical protein JD844_018022 [Phrynosoma platyrhinos]|uniref:Uncharacterized protein n=1 Tax=Phrynosoma platyrhinos TaxID=52577 RepID=A0ABQ7SMV5_PHRPL|nr:hypothetical protein JD844_018022 [Phrynosoma platyrhinos]